MKTCVCQSKECNGKVEKYEIYSPANGIYPNRFWGISNYCETHKQEDQVNGFIFKEASEEDQCIVL